MKKCLDVCSHHNVFTSMLLLFQNDLYILQMLKWWLFLSLNKNNRQWLEVRNGLSLPAETHLSQRRSDMASLLSNLHRICCKLNPTMLIKLDFVLHSCWNFTESSVGALRESGGRTHGTVRIFQNGFCTCECFDNYCTLSLSLLAVWWWPLLSTSLFCFHIFPILSFTCVWNSTHADLMRAPFTGNFKRKQWKPDLTIYFLGERTHKKLSVLLKMRTNCRENCCQFEKRNNSDLLLQGKRTRCDPWFTQ